MNRWYIGNLSTILEYTARMQNFMHQILAAHLVSPGSAQGMLRNLRRRIAEPPYQHRLAPHDAALDLVGG